MSTKETPRLTPRQVIVTTALFAQPQYGEVRRNAIEEINRIVADNNAVDQITAQSESKVTPLELRASATYLGTLINGETRFDQQEFNKHIRGLAAIFEAPQLQNVWNAFAVKTQQVAKDTNLINAIVRQYSLRVEEVTAELPRLIEYRPAMAGAQK